MIAGEEKLNLVFDYHDHDLKTFLEQFPPDQFLDQGLIKSILYQILQGVAYCHAKRIMHRDLKPQNILIDDDGNILYDI